MKKKKHPKEMTNDELLAHVFHPKVVRHVKRHIAKLDSEKEKRSKKTSK
jgi:hypothetical protein